MIFPITRKRILAILGYIVFLNFFFFREPGPMSLAIMAIGQFFFLTLTFKSIDDAKKNIVAVSGFFAALLFFATGMAFRANTFVQMVLGFVTGVTLQVYAYILVSNIPMVRSLFELILAPLYFVFTYIRTFFRSIKIILTGNFREAVPERSAPEKNNLVQSLVIGLVIGLFVIGILVSMMTNADPIFASFVKNIVSADFLQSLLVRMILSLVFAGLLIPYLFMKRDDKFNSPIGLFKKINFVNEMTVIMALVAVVIGVFLAVQWPYVFVKVPFETDLSKYGVATYSEYVKKGFGELLRISLFVYGLIWSGLVILRENKAKTKNILKYVQAVVLVEFFIFLVSIFRRVWLYQSYHGWSLGRIYGSLFLFWVLGITVFLAARHFWTRRWVIAEMVFTTVLLFSVGIFNVESFIVRTHPPTVNKKIDYVYLSRLSADGYEGWEQAFMHAKEIINKYENTTGKLDRNDRKEIAYAGIIIRELSSDYKELITQYATPSEKKQYLTEVLTYIRNANYKLYVQPGYQSYIQGQNNYIEDLKSKVQKGEVDYRKTLNSVNIFKSDSKIRFDMGSSSTVQSFYDVIQYPPVKASKPTEVNKENFLDRLYTWNYSRFSAYKKIMTNQRQSELLQMQGKYFNLYMRVISQPANERSFDMDISMNSPLVD